MLLRGARRRQEQEWEHTRQLGAWMMQCVAGEKAPTPEQLFPLPADADRAKKKEEEAAARAAAALAGRAAMLERIAARSAKMKQNG